MYITRYLTFNRAFLGNPIKYCVSLKIRRSSRIVNNLFVVPSTQIKLIVSATDFIDLNSSKKLLVSKLDSVGNLLWILVRCEQSSRLKQSFFYWSIWRIDSQTIPWEWRVSVHLSVDNGHRLNRSSQKWWLHRHGKESDYVSLLKWSAFLYLSTFTSVLYRNRYEWFQAIRSFRNERVKMSIFPWWIGHNALVDLIL